MSDTNLVDRLAEDHSSVVATRVADAEELQERIQEFEYVFIKFTETNGGTELGVSVDREASDFSGANFESGTGQIHLVGSLTLNYTDVECEAVIDLNTMEGKGHLNPLVTAEESPLVTS